MGPKTHVFVVFCSVWVHLGPFRYCIKFDAKCAKLVQLMQSSCHEVISELFIRNAPDPPQWTLNSFFGEFRSAWLHLGSFRYYTKLDAIWVELVPLLKNVRATRSCQTVLQ